MRRSCFVTSFAASVVLAATVPLLAHHAPQAEFDLLATPRLLTATFTKLEWTNPHPYMYLTAKDASGKETRWTFELDGIQKMRKAGFDRTFVKWGDVLIAEYWPARDGTNHGYLRKLTLPDGRTYELVFTQDLKKATAGEP